jgi:hypothetical protein
MVRQPRELQWLLASEVEEVGEMGWASKRIASGSTGAAVGVYLRQ